MDGINQTAPVVLICLGIAITAMLVFGIIIEMKFFKKASVPQWKVFVPIMGEVNHFDIMWSSDEFWGMTLTGGFISFLGRIMPSGSLQIALSIIGGLICAVFWMLACLRCARRFGKSTGFAIGLFLLPIVFFAILAFGKAEFNKDA